MNAQKEGGYDEPKPWRSITLEGRVKEAIQFYEQAIDAEILSIITYGEMSDMPNTFTDDLSSLVAHAKLKVGAAELMLSDAPGGSPIETGKRVAICITTNDVEQSKRILKPCSKEGKSICRLKRKPSALDSGM